MADRRVSLLCYMNGDMVDGPSGISYTKPPVRHLRANMGLGYEEFMSFVYNSLEIDNEKMILTITYRYPAFIGSGTANYVPVRIDDEASLKDVWEIVAELPPPKCMELYIDLRTRDSYNSTNCNMALHSVAGPSTQPNMEQSHCASPLMSANPEMDEDPRSCDELNSSEDGDYCGSDEGTSEESSDDDRDDICVISDRHPGILVAMNNPQNGWTRERAHHRFCLQHICSNFNMRFGSKELKDMVYLAGAQHQPRKFKAVMTELQEMNAECISWFNDLHRAQWTNAYDKGYRYGWMTTNLAECFNGVLKGARFYPITALVQVTFYRVLEFFNKRRDEIGAALGRGEVYTGYALKKLANWAKSSGGHNVTLVNRDNGTFEVVTAPRGHHLRKGSNKQIVKLQARRCTCMKWQCYDIPCSHVQAVCASVAMDAHQYIEEYYRLVVYSQCYAANFHPIPHEDYWPSARLPYSLLADPSRKRVKKGRPQQRRLRTEMDWRSDQKQPRHMQRENEWRETPTTLRCSLCKQDGHNRRTCSRRQQQQPPSAS